MTLVWWNLSEQLFHVNNISGWNKLRISLKKDLKQFYGLNEGINILIFGSYKSMIKLLRDFESNFNKTNPV